MSQDEVHESRIGFVADHARRYAASGGRDGGEANGLPVLLLTCRGRRSGQLRRTPVAYHTMHDDLVVVAAARGAPRHPDWYSNLAEDPAVTVQVGDEVFPATATTATGAQREQLWAELIRAFPPYGEHQDKAGRELPVVLLRRADQQP